MDLSFLLALFAAEQRRSRATWNLDLSPAFWLIRSLARTLS
jgi:hypothetical protein